LVYVVIWFWFMLLFGLGVEEKEERGNLECSFSLRLCLFSSFSFGPSFSFPVLSSSWDVSSLTMSSLERVLRHVFGY